MEQKNIQAIYDSIREPAATSILTQVDDRYLSMVKVAVGKAFFVYGSYGFRANFLESFSNKYDLVAIVRDSVVYVVDSYFFNDRDIFRKYQYENMMYFSDYVQSLVNTTTEMYERWYDALPDEEMPSSRLLECQSESRKNVVRYGSDTSKFSGAPKMSRDIIEKDEALRVLSGSTTVEELFQTWTDEQTRNMNIMQKAFRRKVIELVNAGGGLSESERRFADAIRGLNVQSLTVDFEHDGITVTGKITFSSLQSAIEEGRFTCSKFASYKEAEKIRMMLCGNRWADIPLSYVSQVISRGKVVWKRDA